MIMIAPSSIRQTAWLPRANPVAKLLGSVALALGLVVTIDPVTSGIVLAVELAMLPACGLAPRALRRVGLPLVLGALSIGLVNAFTGTAGVAAGLALGIRLLAIALPGALSAATTDPTELGDALVQRLRVPERPAVGALAALRLLPLLGQQWRTLTLARRARGLEAGRNPAAAVRIFASKVFALLVRAIRAGTLLATAMDARGFGTGPRTHARVSIFRRSDAALVVGAISLVVVANVASALLGTWRPV